MGSRRLLHLEWPSIGGFILTDLFVENSLVKMSLEVESEVEEVTKSLW